MENTQQAPTKIYSQKMTMSRVPDEFLNKKFTWDFGMGPELEALLKDDEFIDFDNMSFLKGHGNMRMICVNVSSYRGIACGAYHYYCSISIDDTEISNHYTRPNGSQAILRRMVFNTNGYKYNNIKMDLWCLSDVKTRAERFKQLEKFSCIPTDIDYYSSRIGSMDTMINGLIEFINDNFEKERFVICIDDLTNRANIDILHIEQKTGIPTILI